LGVLCKHRSPGAVPYGGKYRVIDFVLSNLSNSGIYDIGLITQYAPISLHNHIGIGRPWGLDRKEGGVRILHPHAHREGHGWYQGTADALAQNVTEIQESIASELLLMFADEIYRMDYGDLRRFHAAKNAELTVGITKVGAEEISRFGMVRLDSSDRVVEFEEKPADWDTELACMGLYLFRKEVLLERISSGDDINDIVFDVIKPMIAEKRPVFGYRFDSYWREVGNIDAYYRSNLELLALRPKLDLYDRRWPVYTKSEGLPPPQLAGSGVVRRSFVADGCDIAGQVENSILFPNVKVGPGSRIRDSIVMGGACVLENASVNAAILDKLVTVGPGARIGGGDDYSALREGTHPLTSGITVIGKRARMPGNIVVGRNCVIDSGLKEKDFTSDTVPSGSYVIA
jgi:glucose-1-phosphate adenylyltransferase